ncbi:MAG: DUF1501 domain-containing protein, partial [Planctomycetota bacterium]
MQPSISRRNWLKDSAIGLGWLAGAAHWSALQAADGLHFPAKAKRIIFLFMDGGPSQVDTWDPKPELTKRNGEP